MKFNALATVLALVPMLASSYPSAFSLSQYSERVYKREARVYKRSTELLSRSARQANQVSLKTSLIKLTLKSELGSIVY